MSSRPSSPRPVRAPTLPAAARRLALAALLLAAAQCTDERAQLDADAARADRMFGEARFREAAELYRSVLGRDPERDGLRRRLAESLARGGREAAAVLEYKALLAANPADAELNIAIGDLHRRMGRTDLARSAYHTAADTPPGSIVGLIRLLELEVEADPAAAVKLAAQGRSLEPGNLEVRLLEARALRNHGDRGAAEACLARLQADAPEDPRVLVALAEAEAAAGRPAAALERYERAVRAGGRDPRPCLGLGRMRLAAGEAREARSAFEAALSRAPGHREARLGLIDALLVGEEAGRAALEVQKLLDARRDDADAYLRLALVREAADDTPGALQAYQQASVLAPDAPRMHYRYGRGLARAGADATATAELERALALDPDNVEAACLLGAIQARSKLDRVRGRQVLEEALARAPDNAHCWHAKALLEESLGRVAAAVFAAQKARRLAPGDPDVASDLQRLQGRLDRLARPISAISR